MYNKSRIWKFCLYLLTLLFIYPLSPAIFKKFILLKEGGFMSPLLPKNDIKIRSDIMGEGHFSARRSNGRRRHMGLDIAGEVGTPVYAAKSGTVRTGGVPYGMGRYVVISHIDGYATVYGHLDSVDVADKNWVWQAQMIGRVGKSGNAKNPAIKPHLHFEIRKDGINQDPLLYITEDNGNK